MCFLLEMLNCFARVVHLPYSARQVQRSVILLLTLVVVSLLCLTIDAAAQGNLEAGKQLYQQRCSPCHGSDGKANTPTAQALNPKPRDHTDGAYMNQFPNEHLFKAIKQGGTAVGKSPIMPPHADLSDQQIGDIVTFVRSLASPPYKGN
jgi:mono/diheme cytochrome c family protein